MKLLLLTALITFTTVRSARILGLFPLPIQSHHLLGSALLKELAIRGHDVTMVSSFPLENPPKNYKDVHLKGNLVFKEKSVSVFRSTSSIWDTVKFAMSLVSTLESLVFEDETFKEFMDTKPEFDLVIHNWAISEALLGIGYLTNATPVAFSVIGTWPMINIITHHPNPYSYVPLAFLPYTDKMTFYERILNTLANISLDLLIHWIYLPYQNSILQKYHPEVPSLYELLEDIDLILVNSHFTTEPPRPYLPNMIQIGGFHLYEKQKLPNDIQDFLDKSKKGVIYFSFGTNVRGDNIKEEHWKVFIEAFSSIEYDVLWKLDKTFDNLPANVKVARWVPQRAVLDHPNIKVFITHGGLGSTVESIYSGVPMICIPFFGDQERNTADTVKNGYGIKVTIDTMTKDELVAAIKKTIEDPIYKTKVQLKSDIYRNQPIHPMDKAVYWIEHVIKHKGAKHLKAAASNLYWYQYMLLDVFAVILLVTFSFAYVIYRLVKCLRQLCGRNVRNVSNKKNK